MTSSRHTQLVNAVASLGISLPNVPLPSPLLDNGYRTKAIGRLIRNGEDSVTPDILIESRRDNYLMIIEAKSGDIDESQARKYSRLTPNIISNQNLSSIQPDQLSIQICYACTPENRETLLNHINENSYQFPLLVYNEGTIMHDELSPNFTQEFIRDYLSNPLRFESEPTDKFYPFGNGDSYEWMAECIVNRMLAMHLRGDLFTELQLVRECQPLAMLFGDDENDFNRGVVGKVLNALNRPPDELLDVLPLRRLQRGRWQIHRFRQIREFQSRLRELIHHVGGELDNHSSVPQPMGLMDYSQDGPFASDSS